MKKLLKNQKGFTIIEVMIVLVIAAVILLIVFLAVPALQRNARNTQRREDVSNYAAAVAEFSNNAAGKIPVTADLATINALAKLGFYTTLPVAITTGAQSSAVGIDTFHVGTGARCDAATIGNSTVTGATPRSVAIRYAVENSSGAAVPQCLES